MRARAILDAIIEPEQATVQALLDFVAKYKHLPKEAFIEKSKELLLGPFGIRFWDTRQEEWENGPHATCDREGIVWLPYQLVSDTRFPDDLPHVAQHELIHAAQMARAGKEGVAAVDRQTNTTRATGNYDHPWEAMAYAKSAALEMIDLAKTHGDVRKVWQKGIEWYGTRSESYQIFIENATDPKNIARFQRYLRLYLRRAI